MGEAIEMGEAGSFGACVQRLSDAFARDGDEPSRKDVERVQSALLAILVARFRSLGVTELCEIADESIARLLKESRRQGRGLDKAAAWLRKTAIHLALDQLKAPYRDAIEDHEHLLEDEFSARLVEQLDDDDQVKRGLGIAIEAGDDVAVKVITEFLDLASELPGSPSTRAVAEHCGYSHTTVQKALRRIRRYVT